ncbi:hypothetical protein RIF29_23908 [Crotalaria pallida]|uniref:Uncharacterized protein n=1 Tax=Crotalaria pallida TaxID=3830 RepID=A0AAN9EKZ6_CROPI
MQVFPIIKWEDVSTPSLSLSLSLSLSRRHLLSELTKMSPASSSSTFTSLTTTTPPLILQTSHSLPPYLAVVALDIIIASSSAPRRKPVKYTILVTLSKLEGSTDLEASLNSGRRIFRKVNKVYGFPKENLTWFVGADVVVPTNTHFASKENFSKHVRRVFDVKSLVRMPDGNARLSVKYPFISHLLLQLRASISP